MRDARELVAAPVGVEVLLVGDEKPATVRAQIVRAARVVPRAAACKRDVAADVALRAWAPWISAAIPVD